MLNLSLCNYSDAYILVSRTATVAELAAVRHNNNIQVVFKNCTQFTDCINELNNTQIDNVKETNVVMLMYNLIEYRDNNSKTSGSLWQQYREKPTLTNAGAAVNFLGKSAAFKFK